MRTRSWCAVRREDHPSVRQAVEAAVRLACEPISDGRPAKVEVRGSDRGRRILAQAVELEEAGDR